MIQSNPKIFYLFRIFLLIILLSGCSNHQKADPPSIASTITPPVLTATQIPLEKTSPSQTASSADTPEPFNVQSKCATITQAPLQQLQGTLVLEHVISSDLREISFLDLKTNHERFISEQSGEYYDNENVSPAGTYFSVETFTFSSNGDYQQGPIQIFNSKADLVTTIELKKASYGYSWLNEENIIMNYPYDKGNPIILISPFKHDQKKLQPFLDGIFFSDTDFISTWGFYGRNKNIYDPQMTRVLYPSTSENGPSIVLRDLEKMMDLASFPTAYGFGNSPIWTLNGEKFALALNTVPHRLEGDIYYEYEIFVINRNGKKLLATNLTTLQKTVYISDLSWSPDGRYIAYWYTNDKNNLYTNLQLAVLDMATQTITSYCLNNGNDPIRFSPIWAPTNDYLLIAYRMPDDKTSSSLLLNILNGKASIIKSDFEPLGWLK